MVAIGSKNILILFILSTFFCTQILSNCVDNLSATNHRLIRRVACPLVTDDSSRHSKRQEPRFIVSQFRCDNATQKTCNNVRRTFEEAGKIIAETFVLKQPILVQVTFTNICQQEPDLCEDKENAVIGSGRSSRDMLILDDDGIARYYPQTLVKQFDLQPHPEYAPIDIICSFNSVNDWYFTDQPTPIRPKQRDMLYIVIHELMHGLGFLSQWNFWFDIGDPKRTLITTQPEVASTDKNETLFGGFKEAAFDRFLTFNRRSHKRLTGVTKELNKFAKSGTVFKNDNELINSFVKSKQVKFADSMSKETTTPKRVACLPRACADVTMILETSLDPFLPGSSVSHVDGKTYTNTPDFLMTFKPISGKTLKEILKQVGGEHPIGPKLKALMECLGWATKEKPNPYRPRLAP